MIGRKLELRGPSVTWCGGSLAIAPCRMLDASVWGGGAHLVALVDPVDELRVGGGPREADGGGVDGLGLHVARGDGGNCGGGGFLRLWFGPDREAVTAGPALTSLQRPLRHLVAKRAQTGPVVSSHLDLIVGPDDEVLQEQVGHVWTGDVLELVVHRQPAQSVPSKPQAVSE